MSVEIEPITAGGVIATLLLPSLETREELLVLSGDWSWDDQDNNVRSFEASFDMVLVDGTNRHTHEIGNFQPISFMRRNASTLITDGVEISVNWAVQWSGVWVAVVTENDSILNIGVNTEATDNRFRGQVI